jgi:hypothetical protein
VRPDNIREQAAEKGLPSFEQSQDTPQDFTERQIITPPEELQKDIEKSAAQIIYEQETGVKPDSFSDSQSGYSRQDLHYEASQTPEPTTFEVRQVLEGKEQLSPSEQQEFYDEREPLIESGNEEEEMSGKSFT